MHVGEARRPTETVLLGGDSEAFHILRESYGSPDVLAESSSEHLHDLGVGVYEVGEALEIEKLPIAQFPENPVNESLDLFLSAELISLDERCSGLAVQAFGKDGRGLQSAAFLCEFGTGHALSEKAFAFFELQVVGRLV